MRKGLVCLGSLVLIACVKTPFTTLDEAVAAPEAEAVILFEQFLQVKATYCRDAPEGNHVGCRFHLWCDHAGIRGF